MSVQSTLNPAGLISQAHSNSFKALHAQNSILGNVYIDIRKMKKHEVQRPINENHAKLLGKHLVQHPNHRNNIHNYLLVICPGVTTKEQFQQLLVPKKINGSDTDFFDLETQSIGGGHRAYAAINYTYGRNVDPYWIATFYMDGLSKEVYRSVSN